MIKRKNNLLVLLVILFASCEKNPPNCLDEDVKNVLFDIVKEQLSKEFESSYFYEKWNYDDIESYAKDNNLNVQNFIDQKRIELEKEAEDYGIKQSNTVSIELDGTRLMNIDKSLKKCECKSDLIIAREHVTEIEYTAQYTEDDKIYVEYQRK